METNISVIMSTYNETEEELHKSINSILNQTYRNIEFIIVNDNPQNPLLKQVLHSIQDSRVVVLENEINMGLVKSLNRALRHAKGDIIVRADADDINEENRIEVQLKTLEREHLDLVGSYIDLIDEHGSYIGNTMRVPQTHHRINAALRWGTVMPHPTWLGRKKVFEELNGYREVPCCEDYDFLIRAVNSGFHVGNVPIPLVQYRVRSNSISRSNAVKQFVITDFLSKQKKEIPTQDQINSFLYSEKFRYQCEQYVRYTQNVESFHNGNISKLFSMIISRYYWYHLFKKIILKVAIE